MSAPVTLITGASKGVGKSLAEHYVAQGHEVIGCSRSEIEWALDRYTHVVADVTDEQSVKAVLREARSRFGRLDNLINNAGIAAMNHALLTPSATVRRILDTNVLGTFTVAREAAKLMRKAGYGRIVNMSSVAVPLRLEGEAAYAASKAAVESLTRVLARELAPLGITVNAVGPGPIDTDLIKGVPAAKIEALVARQVIGRKSTFEDVSNVIDFYLRAESGFVTGQILYLGGV